MGAIHGSASIITDSSLKCYLDASNPNSYDGRENLLTYSDQFDNNTVWGKYQCTLTPNTTTAPDGATTADTLTIDSNSGVHDCAQFVSGASVGVAYTFSIYLKAGNWNFCNINIQSFNGGTFLVAPGVNINLNTGAILGTFGGTVNRYSILSVGNGWYRVSINVTTPASVTQVRPCIQFNDGSGTNSNYTGNSSNYFYMWGAQLERTDYPTPYTATVASTITRSSQWTDLSGNGKHYTMLSVGSSYGYNLSSPTTGAIPHIACAGGRTIYSQSNASTYGITNSTGYTILMGFMESTITASSAALHFPDATAGRGIWMHCVWSDGNVYFDQGGCCNVDTRTQVLFTESYTRFNIVTIRRSQVERSIFKNGIQLIQNTATPASINLSSTQQPGFNTDSSWTGMINCFLVYNRALSNMEIARVAGTLKARYGTT